MSLPLALSFAGASSRAVYVASLLVALLIWQPSSTSVASTISAKVSTGAGASHKTDRQDPDVWWTSGTFHIDSSAEAQDAGGKVSDADRWPAAGFRDKALLGLVAPVVPGTQIAPASGTGADFSASAATSPGSSAWGWGWGSAYLDTTLIDEYEMNVEAYAFATIGVNDKAEAAASIVDPFTMGWDDAESHSLIFDWTLPGGSELLAPTDSMGWSEAWYGASSYLDFGSDSSIDQLFWSWEVSIDKGSPYMSLDLGPGVYLYDGRSVAELLAELESFWLSDTHFLAPTDFMASFAYDIMADEPGSVSFSFDVHGGARIQAVPEPATAVASSLALAVFILTQAFARRAAQRRGRSPC